MIVLLLYKNKTKKAARYNAEPGLHERRQNKYFLSFRKI